MAAKRADTWAVAGGDGVRDWAGDGTVIGDGLKRRGRARTRGHLASGDRAEPRGWLGRGATS